MFRYDSKPTRHTSRETDAGSVLYRSERHWRTKRNFEVFSASQFIAALLD